MSIINPPKVRSNSDALAQRYARLVSAIEKSAERVEAEADSLRPEVVDRQRRMVASLQECADLALSMAEIMGDAACPRDITCLHLGDWNRCNACFEEQAGKFFDQAGKFLNALMASGEPVRFPTARAVKPDTTSDVFLERSASFTEAQQRVFDLLKTGLPNKLIAYEIGVSEATIKAHVSAVLRKLRVRSRAQAIALSSAFERTRSGSWGLPSA